MANGTFGGGDGSSGSPWIIEDAADLNAIRIKPATHYFKLKNNIDLDVAPYNSAGWTPIANNFQATLDGDGYVIKNLMINNPALIKAGLFADLLGNVRDLGLVNVNITANEKVGAIAGRMTSDAAALTRCYVTGNITAKNLVGSLIGEINQTNNIMIQHSHASTTITVEADFAGGIVGYITSPFTSNRNRLLNNFYNGTINGGNLITAGPIYGKAENLDIQNCFYDKDKTIQKDEDATGLTTAETMNPVKFDVWRYIYRNNVPTWKFLENNPPKLWYEDLGRIMVSYGGKYYVYNTITNTWTWISDTLPDRATFWAQGMKDLDSVPIAKFKELDQYGTVQIVNMIESKAQGVNTKMQVQLLFDVLRSDRQLNLTSLTEDDLATKTDDYDPVSRYFSIVQEQKLANDTMGLDIVSEQEAAISPTNLTGMPNLINAKYALIVTDDEQAATVAEKSVIVGYSNPGDANTVYKGLVDHTRSLQTMSVQENTVSTLQVNIASETELPVNPEALTDSTNHIRTKDLLITADDKVERDNMTGNAMYEMYKTAVRRDRAIKVDTKGEGKSRYLISVNNGGKWLTYNAATQTWIETELRNISDSGITITQMADPKIWDLLPTDYRSKVKYAIGIRNESFNSTHKIGKFDIEFQPNKGPLVQDAQVQVQSDKVILSGALFDAENDLVEYQIVTKQFNEVGWRQITPEQPGWYKRKNGYQFYHEYDLTHFRAGDNSIKVITRDSRGVVYEKEFQIILITGEPIIDLNFNNEFYMSATINHSLGKKIRFRILVNNNQMTPLTGFTDWKEAPFTFDYSWDSKDLLYGLPNEITIQAVDELNTEAEIKFHVIGGYRSLLFKDENNFYYSTDKGDILQQLDFGTVIGGLLSEPRIVFLENRTGLTLENVEIWADNTDQEENVKLKISETLDPFLPVENIPLTNTMANGEVKPFYVRIESDIDVESIRRKVFRIYAKGDPVVV